MLATLPPDVLCMVFEKLSKSELKSLCHVSKAVNAVAVEVLWRSITILLSTKFSLNHVVATTFAQSPRRHTSHLHFVSDFQRAASDRCPHGHVEYHDEDGFEIGCAAGGGHRHFESLSQWVKSLVGQFEDGQLRSFSWDLGTCISSEILGQQGVVSQKQPLIRSLRLTTDCTCPRYRYFDDNERERDVSAFHHLESLCWRAPHADDLDALAVAIRNNAKHLHELEVDFVNWQSLRDDLGYDSEDEDGELGFFAGSMLQLGEPMLGPMFLSLRVLSLSQVPLGAVMARIIKFDTLRSLTLRKCPDWHRFIERVVRLGHQIQLKTLEIQDCESVSGTMGEYALEVFLEAFEGLEGLFLDIPRPISTHELWNYAANHQATLKRFVQHNTVVGHAGDLGSFEEEADLPDPGLLWHDVCKLEEKSWNNPPMGLDLEYIGLNCIPELLGPILLPFTCRPSLKIVHIRQSGRELKQHPGWTVDQSVPTSVATDTSDADTSDAISINIWESSHLSNFDIIGLAAEVAGAGVPASHEMRRQFCQFAEWAFGPRGLVTLEAIAYGDFAYGSQAGRHNLVLCRAMNGESSSGLLDQDDPRRKELVDRYRNALEACPDEPLLAYA